MRRSGGCIDGDSVADGNLDKWKVWLISVGYTRNFFSNFSSESAQKEQTHIHQINLKCWQVIKGSHWQAGSACQHQILQNTIHTLVGFKKLFIFFIFSKVKIRSIFAIAFAELFQNPGFATWRAYFKISGLRKLQPICHQINWLYQVLTKIKGYDKLTKVSYN